MQRKDAGHYKSVRFLTFHLAFHRERAAGSRTYDTTGAFSGVLFVAAYPRIPRDFAGHRERAAASRTYEVPFSPSPKAGRGGRGEGLHRKRAAESRTYDEPEHFS
jgi:hypothetical protein